MGEFPHATRESDCFLLLVICDNYSSDNSELRLYSNIPKTGFGLICPLFLWITEFSVNYQNELSSRVFGAVEPGFRKNPLNGARALAQKFLNGRFALVPLNAPRALASGFRVSDKGKAEPPCSHTRRFRFPKEGVKNETQNSNGGVTQSRYTAPLPGSAGDKIPMQSHVERGALVSTT